MKRRNKKLSPLSYAAIMTGGLFAVWLLITVVVVIITKTEWKLYPLILLQLWIPIVVTLAFTFVFSIVLARYYERAVIATLVVVGVVFMFASTKDTSFREIVYPTIDKYIDVDLLVAGITLIAFAVTLGTLAKRYKPKDELSESRFISGTVKTVKRYTPYYRGKTLLEPRYRKRVRKINRYPK